MKTVLFLSIVLLQLVCSAPAKEIKVDDLSGLKAAIKSAMPGDVLVMSQGEWKDVSITFACSGTQDAPITLRASVPGKTILSGSSSLRIGGQHLVVEGLLFENPPSSVNELIVFRENSKQLASHCRLTNCAVSSDSTDDDKNTSQWIGVYGFQNRVDHCTFQGKTNGGTTFVVWLSEKAEQQGQHRIDSNYFGPREKLGKNGGETIRIGDSDTSLLTAECVIERNLFEKCNGEAECISNKSCKNIYRENSFLEVSGTLTLRHGNECLVERNNFFGNDARGTGGIRVIGEDHIVRGNYLERLTGDDARSAITLMMGIPNSPANRYFQVRGAVIEKNSIVDCKYSFLVGLSDDKNASLAPVETIIRNNRVTSKKGSLVESRCSHDGIQWTDNQFAGAKTDALKSLKLQDQVVDSDKTIEPKIERPELISRSEAGTDWTLPK